MLCGAGAAAAAEKMSSTIRVRFQLEWVYTVRSRPPNRHCCRQTDDFQSSDPALDLDFDIDLDHDLDLSPFP